MSYLIDGANGQDWQGANWVFYDMCEYLLSILQDIKGAENLAKRLEYAFES